MNARYSISRVLVFRVNRSTVDSVFGGGGLPELGLTFIGRSISKSSMLQLLARVYHGALICSSNDMLKLIGRERKRN